MSTMSSANMNLPVPVVGQEPGPEWASDLNNCLTIVDQHNHAAGSGVQITPAGLNINADLSFNSSNATALRSSRYSAQLSPLALSTDLGCLYVSGVDLFYNDISGNQIRITQSGGIAGTPGSISNLTSPASAAYVSANQTFVWQSNANTPANMDGGSVVLRNILANSKGLTLSPPAAMGSNYSLVLPSLPSQTNIMTLDTSGNMAAPFYVDNTTIEVNASNLRVKPGSIGSTQIGAGAILGSNIAAATVARSNLVAVGEQLSADTGHFGVVNDGSYHVAATITITTTGRPVVVGIMPSGGASNDSNLSITGAASANVAGRVQILRDSTVLATSVFAPGTTTAAFTPSSMSILDTPVAGTYTYTVQLKISSNGNFFLDYSTLYAYELK